MILEVVEGWCERTESPSIHVGCGPHGHGRLELSLSVVGVVAIAPLTPEQARRVAAMLERWATITEEMA